LDIFGSFTSHLLVLRLCADRKEKMMIIDNDDDDDVVYDDDDDDELLKGIVYSIHLISVIQYTTPIDDVYNSQFGCSIFISYNVNENWSSLGDR
jgi:hypothetical protein